ncbi:MAG: hypothetical protein EA424_00530 [Planctomycetaceae bacterium]|nr:MAG: hypothetical protein EA424_00530 [Planctomycetaceae bacterium]
MSIRVAMIWSWLKKGDGGLFCRELIHVSGRFDRADHAAGNLAETLSKLAEQRLLAGFNRGDSPAFGFGNSFYGCDIGHLLAVFEFRTRQVATQDATTV